MELFPAETIVILASMFFFLVMGAIFDAHGAEVPDALSVPYAILGIAAAILDERFISGCIAGFLLVFILQPFRPKFLIKLNNWFVNRSYSGDDQIEEETVQFSEEADRFSEKNGEGLSKLVWLAYFIIPIAVVSSGFWDGWKASNILFAFLFTCSWVLFLKILVATSSAPRTEETNTPDEDPVSALGGADVIFISGMLGLYGVIPFVYGLAATCMVHVCWMLFRRAISKGASVGAPMVPTMCVTAPIRLYLAVAVCPPVIDAFRWMAENTL